MVWHIESIKSLLQKQAEYELEMKIATNIQKTLLKSYVPELQSIDIGMVSFPIRKMNGDYVHFFMMEKSI